MKFFQKLLIGLCSLLPCFGAVPQESRVKTLEIQNRKFQEQLIFQIDKVTELKFLSSSFVSSTYGAVQSNFSFDMGASFALQPEPERTPHGATFRFTDVLSSIHSFGFLLYCPLFDHTNQFVNQFQIYPSGVRPTWDGHVQLHGLDVFVFSDSVNDIATASTAITFKFTLSTPYTSIDKDQGWFYLLPFLCAEPLDVGTYSAIGLGLYQGFLAGLSYTQPSIQYQYQSGFNDGESSGLKKGYSQGYEAGKAVADKVVYKKGYDKGYTDGSNTLTPATTIWGLFGAIASVPTEILNGMGGIAIWNTPILAILFSLLFLAMVLWIIRKFI